MKIKTSETCANEARGRERAMQLYSEVLTANCHTGSGDTDPNTWGLYTCFLSSLPMRPHITLSLVITYNSLSYKDSPTPKLAAKRSANFFRFTSDSLQIHFRFTSDSIQIQFTLKINMPILEGIDFINLII
ncbi:hypothetical protein VN97_g4432 [Penicillium thymicola]|uniref:Uncharacterized protein n=1 Tax=Penicillium thymicola TaxID=293382 RepID=A0AAI9TK95_PENTH|nr:hypothetical protein VN97_g4432 [Penicillium thymicola]